MRTLFSRADRRVEPEQDDRAEHVDVEIAGWTVVRLTSDLTVSACDDLERQLRPRLVRGARLALDLRHAHLHREACPTVLRELQSEAELAGAELVVVEADPVLRSQLLLAGVVDVHPSLDAAVHHGAPVISPVDLEHEPARHAIPRQSTTPRPASLEPARPWPAA